MSFSLFSCLVAFAAVSLVYARGEGEECGPRRGRCDEGLVCCLKDPEQPSGVTTPTAPPAEGVRFWRFPPPPKGQCVAKGSLDSNCTMCSRPYGRPPYRWTTTVQPTNEESYTVGESARFGFFGRGKHPNFGHLPHSTCGDNLKCDPKTNTCVERFTTTAPTSSSTTTASTTSSTTTVAPDAAA